MIGNSYVSQRSTTVDYPAADFCLCLLRHVQTQVIAVPVRHAVHKSESQYVILYKISSASISFIDSLTLKILEACQRGLQKIQQFPDHTQYRDSRIHLISARISTPTSFPMVCGLENTNVHVSWSWAAKEKSPPKRQSCMLLVALKLFTIVQHNVTLTTMSHGETAFFSPLMSHNR